MKWLFGAEVQADVSICFFDISDGGVCWKGRLFEVIGIDAAIKNGVDVLYFEITGGPWTVSVIFESLVAICDGCDVSGLIWTKRSRVYVECYTTEACPSIVDDGCYGTARPCIVMNGTPRDEIGMVNAPAT